MSLAKGEPILLTDMYNRLRNFFVSSQDQDPDFVRLVKSILVIVMLANAGGIVFTSGILGPETRNSSAVVALSVTLLLEAIAFVRVWRGRLGMAKVVVPLALIVAITIVAIRSTGVHSVAVLTFPLIIIISTLLLGERASYTATPLVIAAVVLIAVSDILGWNTSLSARDTGLEDIFLTSMLMYATSATLQLLTRRLNENLRTAGEAERAAYVAQILDQSQDAFIGMDEAGLVLTWNPQAERMFGWRADDIVGKPLDKTLLPSGSRDPQTEDLRRYLSTGEGEVLGRRMEIMATHRDGREIPAEIALTRVARGGVTTLTTFVRDLTERKFAEIAKSSEQDRRRVQQFEAIARMAHTAAAIENLQELLERSSELIAEQFGYYNVGIYVLDANKEYAVLQAASSEAGRQMLQSGHSIKVGDAGVIGYVSETGLPRIASDVDMDRTDAATAGLPEARSEMALPLHVAGDLIGVLDVQSLYGNAFTQADLQVFSTLADLVAIAIQNVRAINTARQLLAESQRVSSGYIQNTWQALKSASDRIGYHFSATSLKPLERAVETPQMAEALHSGKVVAAGGNRASLAVPIVLRGNTIGAMELRAPQGHTWSRDEIDIAEAVAERLSLAIETATVLEATQRRATLEQLTSEMSSKISTSTRIESILRTTAEELSRALGGSEVLVQIQSESNGHQAKPE